MLRCVKVRIRLVLATGACLMTLGGAVIAHGDTQGEGFVAPSGARALAPATRGTSVQATPTSPPPTPAPTTPANTDRNIVHLDSLDLPADSGTGRRVVYSKSIQRVWLVEDDGSLFNTHRVSGRMDQPDPGFYRVNSQSIFTCSNIHTDICMRFFVRFAVSRRGNGIGFHEIPVQNGQPLQTEEQLGSPLSGGCVRQSTADAILMWNWAQVGTVVVVLP